MKASRKLLVSGTLVWPKVAPPSLDTSSTLTYPSSLPLRAVRYTRVGSDGATSMLSGNNSGGSALPSAVKLVPSSTDCQICESNCDLGNPLTVNSNTRCGLL